jgi:hypothetical protein
MQPTIHIDASEWTRAARDLFGTEGRSGKVGRSLTDFINDQAFFVTGHAMAQTHKADASKIERDLGGMGPVLAVIKAGRRRGQLRKVSGVRHIKEDSLAARILKKIFNETHIWQDRKGRKVPGTTILERVNKFINQRKSSVGFLKSGWIPAYRKLGSVLKWKSRGTPSPAATGARQFGKEKGRAVPAVFHVTSNIEAVIENSIPKFVAFARPYGEEGLRAGLAAGAASMIAKLEERLKRDIPEFR